MLDFVYSQLSISQNLMKLQIVPDIEILKYKNVDIIYIYIYIYIYILVLKQDVIMD